MVDVVFVADAFVEEIPQGGAELANKEIVNYLRNKGLNVEEVHGFKLTPAYLQTRKNCFFILGSFLSVPADAIEELESLNYLIYEHDHKYCSNRNPAKYINFKVPENQLVYKSLYRNATRVCCQSQFHVDIVTKNLPLYNNLYNMGGSFWSDHFLDNVEKKITENILRQPKVAIMKSDNPIKGQSAAEFYCQKNNLEYDLVAEPDPYSLFEKLLQYEYFAFLPSSPETFSRIFMEAKLAGCKIITNEMVGALNEKYTYSDQKVLLEEVITHKREKLEEIYDLVCSYTSESHFNSFEPQDPEISIITSVYEGSEFIDKFLNEITQQTIFSRCELILVDCNKTEDSYEKKVIDKYMEKYSNIIYHYQQVDPGVYGAWNIAINISSAKYITNANLDDCRSYDNLELCLKEITTSPEIDLVYPAFLITGQPDETFYTTKSRQLFETHEYDPKLMFKCLPGCMPLWKKELHSRHGYFDEKYSSAGDLEFWLRCVKSGSSFKRVSQVLGLYYFNPKGLSTSSENHQKKTLEEQEILNRYRDIFKQ
jgi:GT2 family glycosyltransferase